MPKTFCLILSIFYLLFMNSPLFSEEISSEEFINKFNDIANEPSNFKDVWKKWNKFLENKTKINQDSYLNIIKIINLQFVKSVNSLNMCLSNYDKQSKNSDTQWIDTLFKKFGKKYLKKEQNHAKKCIAAIYSKTMDDYCSENDKDALLKESQQTAFFLEFFDLFFEFYSSLSDEEKKLMKKRNDFAISLKKILESYPLHKMRVNNYHRNLILLERAKLQSDLKLFDYLLNLDDLKRPFDFFKVTTEFDKKLQQ